jgi:hypothetical protein
MTKITLDTNVLSGKEIICLCQGLDVDITRISVSDRELQRSSISILPGISQVNETFVIGESPIGVGAIGSEDSPIIFEAILDIISNGSFPKMREKLTSGQTRQLRDAMIFSDHVQSGSDIFVSEDKKAFVKQGRKELLEGKFSTRIFTVSDLREWCNAKRK